MLSDSKDIPMQARRGWQSGKGVAEDVTQPRPNHADRRAEWDHRRPRDYHVSVFHLTFTSISLLKTPLSAMTNGPLTLRVKCGAARLHPEERSKDQM